VKGVVDKHAGKNGRLIKNISRGAQADSVKKFAALSGVSFGCQPVHRRLTQTPYN